MAKTEVNIQPDSVVGALTREPNPAEATHAHRSVANAHQNILRRPSPIIKVTLKLSIYIQITSLKFRINRILRKYFSISLLKYKYNLTYSLSGCVCGICPWRSPLLALHQGRGTYPSLSCLQNTSRARVHGVPDPFASREPTPGQWPYRP
jgi:hypothetical protein